MFESPTLPLFRIPGRGKYNLDVISADNFQISLQTITGGKSERSIDLKYKAELKVTDLDNTVVSVTIDGLMVGYLLQENAESYLRNILKNMQTIPSVGVNAKIVGGWYKEKADGSFDSGEYRVWLDLPEEFDLIKTIVRLDSGGGGAVP